MKNIRYILLEDLTCEPPLKAKNPNNKINPPSAAKGTECPGISIATPSFVNLPFLGPIKMHPTRAHVPPNKCTIPLPAKSLYPKSTSHPAPWD